MVKAPIGIGGGNVNVPARDQTSFDRLVRGGGGATTVAPPRAPSTSAPPATARGAGPVATGGATRSASVPSAGVSSFVPQGLQMLVNQPVSLNVDTGAPGSLPGQPFQTFGEASDTARNQNGY